MSHRIAVMKDGEVVESGGVEQIFSAPRHPWTRQLLSSVERCRYVIILPRRRQ